MIEVEIDKDVYLPCYHHLLEENDIDIEILWGGRDSGKSKVLSQFLPEQCMTLDYFRCALIKQTHESIKDSQWQMIKDTCEDWGIDHLFNFTVSPLSIKCVTGNTFLARGMDKPAKIRSLANPSHVWVEEANQISEEGFVTILTGMRSEHGRVKLFLSLNPEAEGSDYEDWWFYKLFFTKHYPKGELSFTDVIEIKAFIKGKEETVRLKYRSTHVTYHNNPHVTPQRIAFHESLKITNPYWYRVFTEGLFGNKLNESPYAYAFNRARHVSNGTTIPHPVLNRKYEVILSFDFNRNPMTCEVFQKYDQKVRVLEVIRIPNSGVDAVCEQILAKYPGCLFLVTGDYNGDNTSSLFAEQITHYKLIQNVLNLSDAQIKIRPNPKQAKNSTHINTILSYYDVVIHAENAKPLIFDLENVKRRADGTILKTDRDKPEQQADALDCFRYFCNEFLDGFQPSDEMILAKAREAGALKHSSSKIIEKIKEAVAGTDFKMVPKKIPIEKVIDHPIVIGDALKAINQGQLVSCKKSEYKLFIRSAILEYAGKCVETKDSVRATIALQEVKRLDNHFK